MITKGIGGIGNNRGDYDTPLSGKYVPRQDAEKAGYTWDPVKRQYVKNPKSPQQQGQEVKDFASGFLGGGGMPPSLGAFGGGGGMSFGTGGGYMPSDGGSGGPVGAGNPVGRVSAPDQTAATNAAFATAKDAAGRLGRASLTSLRDELGSTGALGGGAEVQGTRDVIEHGAGLMGQASRDLAGKQADLSAEFSKLGYQGDITQRGQDIASQEANARIALARQEAATRVEQSRQQQQMQLLQMVLGSYGKFGGGESDMLY